MQNYTLAFIFNKHLTKVLLIHKQKPDWQKGKINGLGGKLEADENFFTCVSREVAEESGLKISAKDWKKIGQLDSVKWHTEVFTCIYPGLESDARSLESQKVRWFSVANLPKNCMPNLFWLIPLCKDLLESKEIQKISVRYDVT